MLYAHSQAITLLGKVYLLDQSHMLLLKLETTDFSAPSHSVLFNLR